MTLEGKYQALLDDLLTEWAAEPDGTRWKVRLVQKITDLSTAMDERFPNG